MKKSFSMNDRSVVRFSERFVVVSFTLLGALGAAALLLWLLVETGLNDYFYYPEADVYDNGVVLILAAVLGGLKANNLAKKFCRWGAILKSRQLAHPSWSR